MACGLRRCHSQIYTQSILDLLRRDLWRSRHIQPSRSRELSSVNSAKIATSAASRLVCLIAKGEIELETSPLQGTLDDL